jgi:subtilase family serine protease
VPSIPLHRHGRRSWVAAAVTAFVAVAVGCSGAGVAAAAADSVSFPGSVPGWATPAADVGAAPAEATIEGEIGLTLQDPAGALELATAVSGPASPDYGEFVSPAQWIDRFSPSAATYGRLVDFLRSAGLIITGTPDSRLFVVFRGTAARLAAAFGTVLHEYTYAGHVLAAPAAAPSVPASLGTAVSAVVLDQGRQLTRPGNSGAQGVPAPTSTPADVGPARLDLPCSNYWGERTATLPPAYGRTEFHTANCGYLPAQFRSAYGVPARPAGARTLTSAPTGGGQTVAIIDAYASPTILADVNTYSADHGEPALRPAGYHEVVPDTFYDQQSCLFPSGWQAEQNIDVEAVHGMAPAAGILYVGGFNCSGGLDVAMSTILDGRLATIVSNSYGDIGEAIAAGQIQIHENLHLQAAAEGIGIYFGSGDSGDESGILGAPSADYPASSPWVTAVGGTTTEIGVDGRVAVETGWGSHYDQVVQDTGSGKLGYAAAPPGPFSSGAGGGRSAVFAQPGYQAGIVPAELARGARVVPDIAADADPRTGLRVGIRPIVDNTTLATGPYTETVYGGTSLACPLVAGEIALVQQVTGRTLGFLGPALYGLYRVEPSAFRDVLPIDGVFAVAATVPALANGTFLVTGNQDTSLTVGPGYDDVTGLGVLSFDLLRTLTARE